MTSATIEREGKTYRFALNHPIDLSTGIEAGPRSVRCFFAPPVEFQPVVQGSFIGDTTRGGAVNFKNIRLNPHGNGTHTECLGHISREPHSINQCLKQYWFFATLLSAYPTKTEDGDRVVFRQSLEGGLSEGLFCEAVVLRTLPNPPEKKYLDHSGTNPPYLHWEAVSWLVERGCQHLLVDLPSLDREEDGGKLQAHKAFWQYPDNPRLSATVTELIYVPPAIPDGLYLLNLQVAPLELDASPSRPVLYPMLQP